jgi:3-deoxy-D-manno-octulosonate 8-phosphate phosphatase (KDO 8-P phosphatase)
MKDIKLIILDVDGTLTNNGIIHHSDGSESKKFFAKDATVLRELYRLDIKTLILTGRESRIVDDRGSYMKITDIMQGVSDKKSALLSYTVQHKIDIENVAYIGDDLNDYAAMKLCGFKACPADAAAEIREICDYISSLNGGHGAVRDICEYILKQNGKYEKFLNLFGITVASTAQG